MTVDNLMQIDEERVSKAMNFLALTDLDYAGAKASVKEAEILCKRVRARVFLASTGSVEARKAEAETHEDTCDADDVYVHAIQTFEGLLARRQRAELTVDIWRSLEATRRRAT